MVLIPAELCQSEYRLSSIQYTCEAKEHLVISSLMHNYNLLP